MAYFDNAATTYPKPKEVYDFMDDFYRNNGANAGRGDYGLALSAGALIKDTRDRLKKLLHCPNKEVIFTPSDTIALNMIIQGIIKGGAVNVYITPFEHNAVTRTLYGFEKEDIIKVNQLIVNKDMTFDMERIKYQFESLKPDIIIMSHASNVFGNITPVGDIFALGKEFNAVTVVDMAQTAGLVDLNVGNECIDFAVFAGHKTLYGPTGISGFLMKPDFDLKPVLFGGTGYESANQDMPNSIPERYEMGTINISGIAGLNAALKWNEEIGIENIIEKEIENRNKLLNILEDFDFIDVVGNSNRVEHVGIISVLIDGITSDSMGPIFDKLKIAVRTGLECAPLAHRFMGTYPSGTIRFSIGYFTDEKDFIDLYEALEYIENNI